MASYPRMADANATRAIIIACVLVSLAALFSRTVDVALMLGGGLIPARLTGHVEVVRGLPAVLTLLSSLFIHGGIGHLAFNMIFLGWIGRFVETILGARRFLVLYFVSGIVGGIIQVVFDPHSMVPVVGASGAISGIFAAYAMLFGKSGGKGERVRALQLAGLWIALQLATGMILNGEAGVGIAIGAHIGGFAAGLVLALPLARGAKR